MGVNLTERFAKSATTEERNSPIFYDDAVIGVGLQVRSNGRKSWSSGSAKRARPRNFVIDSVLS